MEEPTTDCYVKAAVKLNKSHKHVRGKTSSTKVLGKLKTERNVLRYLDSEGAPAFIANVLFDGGSDGGLFKADMQEAVDLAPLDPQHIGLTTATGTVWNNFV